MSCASTNNNAGIIRIRNPHFVHHSASCAAFRISESPSGSFVLALMIFIEDTPSSPTDITMKNLIRNSATDTPNPSSTCVSKTNTMDQCHQSGNDGRVCLQYILVVQWFHRRHHDTFPEWHKSTDVTSPRIRHPDRALNH